MTVMQFDTCATLGALEHKKRRDSMGSSQGVFNREAVIMALDSSNRVWYTGEQQIFDKNKEGGREGGERERGCWP